MVASSIRPNQVFKLDETVYRLVERQDGHTWHVQRMDTRESSTIAQGRLLELYASGALELRVNDVPLTDVESSLKPAHTPPRLSKRGQRAPKLELVPTGDETYETKSNRRKREVLVARRNAKLAAVAAQYPWCSDAQSEAIREAWPSIYKVDAPPKLPATSTIYRWYRKLAAAGNNSTALVPRHDKKGRCKEELPAQVQNLIEEVTDEYYMQSARINIEVTYGHLKERIRAENAANDDDSPKIKVPPKQRLREHIESIDAFEKHAARYGHPSALKKYRSVLKTVHAERPLDRVELDATRLDIWILDDTGVPMGRPWLHACIDVRTRCILGYYLSFEPPCLATFFECVQHAVLPKSSQFLTTLGVEKPWPCYGAMQRLVLDNALENHSAALDELSALWGLEIQFCPRARPWYKARIERFMRTLNSGLCHTLPGSTFSNIFDRGDANPQREAVLTWSTFEKMVAIWINDVYHQRKHRALIGSPAQEWAKLVKEEDLLLPCRPKAITQIARTPVMCRLSHTGIQRHGLFWNSPRLTDLRKELGSEVDVKVFFNHMNLGDVSVMHPRTGAMIDVPSRNPQYASNLTLFQHLKIKAFAESEALNDDVDGYLRAESRIRQLIADAMTLRNYSIPTTMARFLLGNGQRSELNTRGQEAANDESVHGSGQPASLAESEATAHAQLPDTTCPSQSAPARGSAPAPSTNRPSHDVVVTSVIRRRRASGR